METWAPIACRCSLRIFPLEDVLLQISKYGMPSCIRGCTTCNSCIKPDPAGLPQMLDLQTQQEAIALNAVTTISTMLPWKAGRAPCYSSRKREIVTALTNFSLIGYIFYKRPYTSRLWWWNEEQLSWSTRSWMLGQSAHAVVAQDLDLIAELPTLLVPLNQLVTLSKLSSPKEGVILITLAGRWDIGERRGEYRYPCRGHVMQPKARGGRTVGAMASRDQEIWCWCCKTGDPIQEFLVSIHHRPHHPTSSRLWLRHQAYNHNLILLFHLPCPGRGYNPHVHSQKSSFDDTMSRLRTGHYRQ